MTATTKLERITVNLVPRAQAALTLLGALTGDSKTDTVNRAIQMYAFFEDARSRGDEILLRHPNGDTDIVVLT